LTCTTNGEFETLTPLTTRRRERILTCRNSNAADLQLLETIGITPDATIREKRPTLRTVGFAVIASLRMQKMREAWAGNKKVQDALIKKFEAMKRGKGRSSIGGGNMK
jgi:hypothetical protein